MYFHYLTETFSRHCVPETLRGLEYLLVEIQKYMHSQINSRFEVSPGKYKLTSMTYGFYYTKPIYRKSA